MCVFVMRVCDEGVCVCVCDEGDEASCSVMVVAMVVERKNNRQIF